MSGRKNIYLIPGLGFDCRIFRHLDLGEMGREDLDWIEPHIGESLRGYASRMAEGIQEKDDPIVLIGHSFGGIIAQEIAQIRPVSRIILLSSIQSGQENPWHFKVLQPMRLHGLASKGLILSSFPFWGSAHGYEGPEEKALFKSMVARNSNRYLRWALRELSVWKRESDLPNTRLIQIHGTRDKTFPMNKLEKPDYVVPGAGHFMVYKQAETISEILRKEIQAL